MNVGAVVRTTAFYWNLKGSEIFIKIFEKCVDIYIYMLYYQYRQEDVERREDKEDEKIYSDRQLGLVRKYNECSGYV